MKKKMLALLLSACMVISMAGCSSGGEETAAGNTGGGGGEGSNAASAEAGDTSLPEDFNATGMPIMNEKITLKVWIEGGADIDWEQNRFVKEIEEKSNIKLQIISTPLSDALQKRNLMLASGDYPDLILTDWPTVFTKSDIMQYGVKEGVLLPITDYIDKYGNNMKRIFEYNPSYRDRCVAPDGEIYGFARFSECYHCSAYPKIYLRQDWMDKLGLKMPETTEELREVLRAFVNDDPNGNGKKDEIGMLGATTWNTMVEYALMGMSFQTVKPDFWLSLGADGKSVEFSPSTDAYREGLRYIKSLYDEGLIDGASFTQKEDQLAQTVRTEPHVVGMYVCDHAGMGYDNNDPVEAENYQILIPVAGPDGFRRQGQNANEGEVQGFHAVITDVCKYPEAAFRLIDEFFYDDDYNMERKYGERGLGWDYCPEGTKNVFGGDARYIVNSLTEDQNAEIGKGTMMVGPQADLAPFRLSMLPEVDDIYQPGNYEQRITLDTQKVEQYIPKERLDYTVFIPLDMADDYAEIQTNLNSFVRMATVQFITGERDIETGWDQYLSELDSYRVDRYIEIYKAAAGR
ncbi:MULTISPECIES: extracellular solute-binding protein [Eisenbergiella]|uniref:extracellular solute-binding protein n=1 Tax=Eisenbergiella TaxID=1432051 RepID=UPI0023F22D83|nr:MULTISPECIES: extracellular solute-binding protein [Eisenbergiella]MCI6708755.1 extracellular solute-binding protein [Eisenbergiella massiliensis]MDY5524853.1 extracellular solute-binding protein [Eisenbergiella porci]